jgi:putative transposase
MQKLGTGYVQYFNQKHKRSGSLFQGVYKAVPIKSNEQLYYLTAYINGNAEIHKIDKAKKYPWCSYPDYLNRRNGTLCNKKIILDKFNSLEDYRQYVNIIIREASETKEEIKKYHLE